MLIDRSSDEAFRKIEQQVSDYSAQKINAKDLSEKDRLKKIADLLNKHREGARNKKGRSL